MRKLLIPALLGYLAVIALLVFAFWPGDLDSIHRALEKENFTKALRLLEPLAEQGNPEARFELGKLYELGHGVNQNSNEAVKLYLKAAAQEHSGAMYHLGRIYAADQDVGLDISEAVKWYGRAIIGQEPRALAGLEDLAKQGNPQAQTALADFFAHGEAIPKSLSLAAIWYRQAVVNGDRLAISKIKAMAQKNLVEAQFQLAQMYDLGQGVTVSKDKAAKFYLMAAKQHHVKAQYILAQKYINGDGVNFGAEQAAVWLKKAANQGNRDAQYQLGLMYESGQGVKMDGMKAASWFIKAEKNGKTQAAKKIFHYAKKGFTAAQFHMGEMYYKGRNFPEDDSEAVKWYEKAANQGHVQAQNNLGYMHSKGQGVPQNSSNALAWFNQAMSRGNLIASKQIMEWAQRGDPEAQYYLGLYYAEGNVIQAKEIKKIQDLSDIIKKNLKALIAWTKYKLEGSPPEAVLWLKRSANQDHVGAQFELGNIFAAGTLVEKDISKAREWYTKAQALGHKDAARLLETL